MKIDLNYHTPSDVLKLTDKVLSELPEEAKALTTNAKSELRKILTDARGNGRLSALSERNEAYGMADNYRAQFREVAEGIITGLNLTPKQEKIAYDIAVLSYREGYTNPDKEEQPKSFDRIFGLLN